MLQVRESGLDEDSMHTALLIVNLDSAIDLPVSVLTGLVQPVLIPFSEFFYGWSVSVYHHHHVVFFLLESPAVGYCRSRN